MEGIKLLPIFAIVFAIFFFSGIGHAIYTEYASEDTTINDSTIHGNDTTIWIYNYGVAGAKLIGLWKFNTTQITGHLINTSGITFNWLLAGGTGQADENMNVYYRPNSTWTSDTANNETFNTAGTAYVIIPNMPIGTGTLKTSTTFYTTQAPAFWGDVYNQSNITIETFTSCYSCDSGDKAYIRSIEYGAGGQQAYLQFNLADYLDGFISYNASDLTVIYDFESTYSGAGYIDQRDFGYNLQDNFLYPIVPMYRAKRETNTDNTLNGVDCSIYSGLYSTAPYLEGINVPEGNYDIFCFDLKNTHGGIQDYASIKIINNTVGNFDFYWAMYSGNITTFSSVIKIPSPAQWHQNLTIQWFTSQELNTQLKYRINSTGEYSAWTTLYNLTDFSTSHSIIINGERIITGYYQFLLMGNNSAGDNFTSELYNFTVGFPETFNQTNASLPSAIEKIKEAGLFGSDTTVILYIFGIIILFFITAISFYFGGFQFGVTIFVSLMIVEVVIGFLPFFLLAPIIIITVGFLTFILRKMLFGG